MDYSVVKIVHLVSLVAVSACLGIGFFAGVPRPLARILGMISSMLLMLSGFALISVVVTGAWPLWVKLKIGLWLIIAISGPVMAKRLKKCRAQGYALLVVLMIVAISLAIIKPV